MPDPAARLRTALAGIGAVMSPARRDQLRAAHHRPGFPCPAREQGQVCCLDLVTDGVTAPRQQPPVKPPPYVINVDPPPRPVTVILTRPWPRGGHHA